MESDVTIMTPAQRRIRMRDVRRMIRILERLVPGARIMLRFGNPWELLVAALLSARCTDKKVIEVTKALFKKYRTLDAYVFADPRAFEKDIYQTGFYHMKAKHILASAWIVKKRFAGRVPRTMADIMTLPGVARKTANVVLGNAYGVVEGIAVDTHVKRLAQVLGLTDHHNPNTIERDLMEIVPKKYWLRFTYLLIEYGRAYCPARKHDHTHCPLSPITR